MNCNRQPLPVVVLCSSEPSAADWAGRAARYLGVEIVPVQITSSAWTAFRRAIAQYDRPVLVCLEHVWFSADLADAADSLIAELDCIAPDWAACGNRGCTWDGSKAYNFTAFSEKRGAGLQSARAPKRVFSLDDNLVLVNCARLRNASFVDLNTHSQIFGVLLSLECLKQKLSLWADPRLFSVRTRHHSARDIEELASSAEFQSYYRGHFINHKYAWPDGDLDLSACVDYSYISQPKVACHQADLIELFGATLAAPSLTLCCRTQFRRSELLRRTLLSFAAAEIEGRESLKIQARLITDCPPEVAGAYLQTLQAEFPCLPLDCWTHKIREPRYSRTDLLFAAVERAETDYLWFVDDDDYVVPGAAQALARTLIPAESALVVGNTRQMAETWVESMLTESKLINRFGSRNLYDVFSGANHVPICGFVLPLKQVKPVLAGKKALGDYYEDYFILLSVLCARGIDIRLLESDLAAVSIRDGDNTVNQSDRSHWNFSYATFMQEILRDPDCSPVFWQLSKR